MPWLPLNWHYRSRHESLIAFSNYQYYDNRLLTFPSPQREGMGVSLRFVADGVYDRGKSATNRVEADAVVREVVRRLRDPELKAHSIGVVTFNMQQQTLIEDLLEAERRRDSTLDAFFSEDASEPVFVKNLENVQGDERDVILFSVCFGPDAAGRPSMNFGPLNREGGERRLNVAITRARREVVVFSSLRVDQIDLARTKARGVRDLKWFLDYAERGTAAIAAATLASADAEAESPFEEAVYRALTARGWVLHKQVGCARYRIDLAVVDPRAPGRYLLGIECDGANYHRAKTARDRDKLREGVLRDLGWKLHRIWSTDWWVDENAQIEKACRAIEAALTEPARTAQVDPPQQEGAQVAAEPAPAAPSTPALPVYVAEEGRALGGQPDFYERPASSRIAQRIGEVVRSEEPIQLERLAARIGAAYGFLRVTPKLVERVRGLVPRELHIERRDGTFLWTTAESCRSYTGFRLPGSAPSAQRDVAEIAIQELANGMRSILSQNVSVPDDVLIRETARLFGIQRVGRHVDERLRRALAFLVEGGRATSAGAVVCLAG